VGRVTHAQRSLPDALSALNATFPQIPTSAIEFTCHATPVSRIRYRDDGKGGTKGMSDIGERLVSAGVVPVIRTGTEALARRAVDLLADEGFRLFEITLTTPGALSIIADLSSNAALLIGVGTVRTAEQGAEAVEAGASFVVSPAFVPGLSVVCHQAGVPMALGAATPTEVLRAHEDGADFVKIFPARQLGGPGFLKVVRSIYPDIALMPTGGIEPADIKPYLQAGAVCLGMGGKLVNEAALAAGDDVAIRAAAREVRAELAAAR